MFELGDDAQVDAFEIQLDPGMSEEDKQLFKWTKISSDDEELVGFAFFKRFKLYIQFFREFGETSI